MSSVATQTRVEKRYFPVPVDAIDHDVLRMDLYIKFEQQAGPPTLYRSSGLGFSPADAERLRAQKVKFLYVPGNQHHIFRRNLTARLDRVFGDETTARHERARIIRESCTRMIEDALLFPGETEPIAAISDISRQFTDWSAKDPEGFSYLLNMSAHDFQTATHMVNVGVGCGLLAQAVFPDDRQFFSLVVQGGLLHDIGKRHVPADVLNKEGKLTPEEWKLVCAHPALGYEELRANKAIPEPVLSMVRNHHERLDGKGYPNRPDASKIEPPARICAVVDVFDAVTAARPYRKPTHPAETLKIIREGRGTHFDPQILDAWTGLVERILESDPSRAPAPAADAPTLSLGALTPGNPADEAVVTSSIDRNNFAEERRRHQRFPTSIHARAQFVRAGKAMSVALGEPFTVHVVDLSRGGLQMHTPWPLSLNDLVLLELPGQGKTLIRLVRVVRVRRTEGKKWTAGTAFVEGDTKTG